MIKKNYRHTLTLFLVTISYLLLLENCFAGILSSWADSRAYKPRPIVFLHGYNSTSGVWQSTASVLSKWFLQYQPVGSYLEVIDIQDNLGSLDTYPNGNNGWADDLKNKINNLLSSNKYGSFTNKLNLICHSMGGLAAREYLSNPKYSSGSVDKLILIGVPNLGSPAAAVGRDLARVYKIGSMTILPVSATLFNLRESANSIAKTFWVSSIEVPEAIMDTLPGSNFLNILNNRPQPTNVQYYGIYGIIGHFLNSFFFNDYYGGDGVVSEKSQLGTGRIIFKENPHKINAFHTNEPNLATGQILPILDSAKPELQIIYPSPNAEFYETSIHIKGNVYKEYLPADSKVSITVRKIYDWTTFPAANAYLKPSDLWIPNNPDSPVAEFDEEINLPGKGTYEISCQIKNPAGVVSEIKKVRVRTLLSGTNIIVHCHNPEGKEISSIEGMSNRSVYIYEGENYIKDHIAYGAHNAETHNKPIPISTGNHTIKAFFNGMLKEETITLSNDETKILTFTFERTEFDLLSLVTNIFGGNLRVEYDLLFTKDNWGVGWLYRKEYTDGNFKVYQDVYPREFSTGIAKGLMTIDYDGWNYSQDISYSTVLTWGAGIYHTLIVSPSQNPVTGNFIPAQSAFGGWFIQFAADGFIPTVYTENLNLRQYLVHQTVGTYQMRYLWAKDPCDNLYFGGIPENGFLAWVDPWHPAPPGGKQYTSHYEGHMKYFKMSSVPFDFTGSAI